VEGFIIMNFQTKQFIPASVPRVVVPEFVEQLSTTLFSKLTDKNAILTHGLIDDIGNALQPSTKVKHEINAMITCIVRFLQDFEERGGTRIERFYVAGDYSRKTAIGTFTDACLVAYVADRKKEPQGILSDIAAQLEDRYRTRLNVGLLATGVPDTQEYLIQLLKNMIIVEQYDKTGSWGKMKVTILLGGYWSITDPMVALSSDGFRELYKKLSKCENVTNSYQELRGDIQEISDRYYQSLPTSWINLIRFVKYWCLLNLENLLPVVSIENIVLKLLFREIANVGRVNTATVFEEFLQVIGHKEALNDLDKTVLPQNAFMKAKFNDKYPNAKKVVVDWHSFDAYPKSSSGRCLRSVFHPSFNTVGTVMSVEWDAIKNLATEALVRGINKSGEMTVSGCFALLDASVTKVAKSSRRSRKLNLATMTKFILSLLLLSVCSSIVFIGSMIESPEGTLPAYRFANWARNAEHSMHKTTWKLVDSGFQPIVDAPIFSRSEDVVTAVIEIIEGLPSMWQLTVPVGLRRRLALSRDYYCEWGSYLWRKSIQKTYQLIGVISSVQ